MAFWKPGTSGPGIDLDREAEVSVPVVYNPFARLGVQQQRLKLPIFQSKTSILYAVETKRVVVIVGETGCGKTTQIPQYLDEAGWTAGGRMVCVTQPRRVAATSVARRVAEEMGCEVGQSVGWTIRFEDCTSEGTRIKFVTDGMLVRETMVDPLLSRYSVVMLDEAHERSIHTDVLLGLMKKILKKRSDLRLVVSSATLDAEAMATFFETNTSADRSMDTACIMSIEGRTFPVDTLYLERPTHDYLGAAVDAVLEIHNKEPPGDILVFLTGQEEIESAVALVHERATAPGRHVRSITAMPFYAGLPSEDQMRVFEPPRSGTRKVVFATNVAETSITINGIVYVVDCGFVKLRMFNGATCMDALVVTQVSQASANQRAGRAGRTCPGRCFRLCTEESFHSLPVNTVPEIQRTNLASLVLQLKALGIDDILHFDFLSPPPFENLAHALELAYALGALDGDCKLTDPTGTRLAEFPVDPQLAKMILASADLGCSEEVLSIASMLSVQNVFSAAESKSATDRMKRLFAVYEGDHLTLLNVFNAFQSTATAKRQRWCNEHLIDHRAMAKAAQVRGQLARYCHKYHVAIKSSSGDPAPILRCIVSGFFANSAHVQPDGSYRSLRGNITLHIHPLSVLCDKSPEWVIYNELLLTTKPYMRDVTSIDPLLLTELAPHFFHSKKIPKAMQ